MTNALDEKILKPIKLPIVKFPFTTNIEPIPITIIDENKINK
tara:strand:+ start:1541 stop:1666 length:126 start_codon:yes stop_codon:yes gene_type:complete